jgi:general secretion pathway protein F
MRFVVRHLRPGTTMVLQEMQEAETADGLRRRLAAAGSVVLDLRPARAATLTGTIRFDVAWWCRELETLLRAGMTAVEAIETLAAGHHDAERGRVHSTLLRALHEGATLSRAMREAAVFPEVLVAGVTASERTSTLAEALHDYLQHDELLQRLQRQAVSAALYPVLVMGLGGAIALFLLLYVIPRFSRMYGDMHHAVSPATQAVLWISRALTERWPVVLLALLALASAAVAAWRSGWLLRRGHDLMEAVAPLRRPWDQFRLAKLYQSLALLFKGGYAFDEALQVCAGLDLGPRLRHGVALARERIAQGKVASEAMTQAGLTEPTTERLLRVGERTGGFAAVLQTIAQRHAVAFSTFVERATRIVEPVLLLAVALVVGGLVVMMYMPIFDMAGGLGSDR